MAKDPELNEEAIDAAYRAFMSLKPDSRVEMAAEVFYSLLKGYEGEGLFDMEEAVNAYSAATERNGFKSGLLAGMRLAIDPNALEELRRPRVIH